MTHPPPCQEYADAGYDPEDGRYAQGRNVSHPSPTGRTTWSHGGTNYSMWNSVIDLGGLTNVFRHKSFRTNSPRKLRRNDLLGPVTSSFGPRSHFLSRGSLRRGRPGLSAPAVGLRGGGARASTVLGEKMKGTRWTIGVLWYCWWIDHEIFHL